MKKKYDVRDHILVPGHVKLDEKEKKELFESYSISLKELPKIRKNDPAVSHLNVKEGEVIKVTRKSPTAGESYFYRSVVNV